MIHYVEHDSLKTVLPKNDYIAKRKCPSISASTVIEGWKCNLALWLNGLSTF